jgi:hypothetical protein
MTNKAFTRTSKDIDEAMKTLVPILLLGGAASTASAQVIYSRSGANRLLGR